MLKSMPEKKKKGILERKKCEEVCSRAEKRAYL